MAKQIRVRSKRLDQVDESKLALALWLLARGMVEDKTSTPASDHVPSGVQRGDAGDVKGAA